MFPGAVVPSAQELFDGTYTQYCGGKCSVFCDRFLNAEVSWVDLTLLWEAPRIDLSFK